MGSMSIWHWAIVIVVIALLFGGQRAVAPGGQATFEFLLALLQLVDLAAQRLDFLLAQQRALLGRAGANHPHPALAQAFAGTGDDGLALAQPRLQRNRGVQRRRPRVRRPLRHEIDRHRAQKQRQQRVAAGALSVGVLFGAGLATSTGAVAAPVAALFAFVDPGLAEDANCGQLIASAR